MRTDLPLEPSNPKPTAGDSPSPWGEGRGEGNSVHGPHARQTGIKAFHKFDGGLIRRWRQHLGPTLAELEFRVSPGQSARGSVLLISLLTATIVGVTLASYLVLISNQNYSIARSRAWNSGVAVMEAGVEEALTQIHYNGYSTLSANGWSSGADGNYHKTRSVGSDGSYYQVSIQPVNPPVIFSTAYVPIPLTSSNYLTRVVRVTTQQIHPANVAGGGLTAKSTITFQGNAWLDSYNSCKGPYNPSNPGTNAAAVSSSTAAGAVNLGGGGDIYGIAVTGPGGTISYNGNSSVGDTNWVATQKGIEPGHSANDANIQFNDYSAPFTSGATPTSGSYNGTNYAYVLNGNLNSTYLMSQLKMQSSDSMLILGNVTLYITGSLNMSGQSFIYVAPGATLNLYLGSDVNMAGGGIINATGEPSNLSIFGLPSCTSLSYTGNSALIATVHAPEADFSFGGGAGAFGAFTANTISLGGNGGVHYDECLNTPAGGGGAAIYVVASWNEL